MKWEEVGKRVEEEEVEEEEGEERRGGGGLPFGRWWGVNDLDSMKSIIVPHLPPERDTLSTQHLFCETLDKKDT